MTFATDATVATDATNATVVTSTFAQPAPGPQTPVCLYIDCVYTPEQKVLINGQTHAKLPYPDIDMVRVYANSISDTNELIEFIKWLFGPALTGTDQHHDDLLATMFVLVFHRGLTECLEHLPRMTAHAAASAMTKCRCRCRSEPGPRIYPKEKDVHCKFIAAAANWADNHRDATALAMIVNADCCGQPDGRVVKKALSCMRALRPYGFLPLSWTHHADTQEPSILYPECARYNVELFFETRPDMFVEGMLLYPEMVEQMYQLPALHWRLHPNLMKRIHSNRNVLIEVIKRADFLDTMAFINTADIHNALLICQYAAPKSDYEDDIITCLSFVLAADYLWSRRYDTNSETTNLAEAAICLIRNLPSWSPRIYRTCRDLKKWISDDVDGFNRVFKSRSQSIAGGTDDEPIIYGDIDPVSSWGAVLRQVRVDGNLLCRHSAHGRYVPWHLSVAAKWLMDSDIVGNINQSSFYSTQDYNPAFVATVLSIMVSKNISRSQITDLCRSCTINTISNIAPYKHIGLQHISFDDVTQDTVSTFVDVLKKRGIEKANITTILVTMAFRSGSVNLLRLIAKVLGPIKLDEYNKDVEVYKAFNAGVVPAGRELGMIRQAFDAFDLDASRDSLMNLDFSFVIEAAKAGCVKSTQRIAEMCIKNENGNTMNAVWEGFGDHPKTSIMLAMTEFISSCKEPIPLPWLSNYATFLMNKPGQFYIVQH